MGRKDKIYVCMIVIGALLLGWAMHNDANAAPQCDPKAIAEIIAESCVAAADVATLKRCAEDVMATIPPYRR